MTRMSSEHDEADFSTDAVGADLPSDRVLIDAEAEGRLLLELAGRISGSLDLQEVLDASLAALRELITFNGGAIQLVENGFLVAAATDPEISDEAKGVRIPVGVGISGGIAESGRAEYLPDILLDERIPEEARKHGVSGGVRSYYGVPLIMQGAPIGVLQIDSTRVDDFSARERALLLAFTPTITAAVQNAQLFEAERQVTERLVQADQLKRDFISIVSHELRTPLTIMLGMSSTMVDHADDFGPDEIRDFAGRTNSAARRLRLLIDDLLYAADLDRGFLSVRPSRTDLPQLLGEIAAERASAPSPLELQIDDDLPDVMVDPDRLHQVLSNLVGNAEKYCPPGLPIHLGARRQDDVVLLTIEDHGPGIAPELREAIFGLFFQAENVDRRSVGGLGIGLFVVRRLCDAMRIPIDVGDSPDGGTTFTLHLPTAEAS